MKVVLREEAAGDVQAVHRLLCDSFQTAGEAALVRRLREVGALRLAMVAEVDGAVGGFIGFSEVEVLREEGSKRVTSTALGLAPLTVAPAHREQGIGSALTRAALKKLRGRGVERVCVLGDPRFYARFGFEPAEKYHVRYEVETPPGIFRVLALKPWAWSGVWGTVHFNEEFSGLDESEQRP